MDSVTSFSYFPIRAISYTGFLVANALLGLPPQGWTSLMVVLLVLGGLQMLMMGVLGKYIWRALDETRSRPRYLIENSTEEMVG